MIAKPTEPIQVGYAQPIKQDQVLFSALHQATLEMEKLVERHGLSPAHRELIWGSSDTFPGAGDRPDDGEG